jgi:hypothetical protein
MVVLQKTKSLFRGHLNPHVLNEEMANISSAVLLGWTKYGSCAVWKILLNLHKSPTHPDGEKLSGIKILQCLFGQRKISHNLYQNILIGIV